MSNPTNSADKQLILRAEGGDPSARIDLAFDYEAAGNKELAVHWMNEAAATGDAFAKMQRAAWRLYGTNFQRDEEAAFLEIEEIANLGGEGNARPFLAVLLAYGIGCVRDWDQAIAWISKDVTRGSARCMTQLALLQPDAPEHLALTRKLLNSAARMDSGVVAPRVGDAGDSPLSSAEIANAVAIAKEFDAASWRPGNKLTVSESPLVEVYSEVAPLPWCRHVIRTAKPLLHGAHVKDTHSGKRILDPMRTNTVALIELWQSDLVFYALAARIASATGDPINRQEPPNILNYLPGQTYEAHYDFIDTTVPAFQNELREQGQRTKTPLIYLNDEYEGGTTAFPKANCAYKANAGDLLVLRNTCANGEPDRSSLHIGTPPISGEKWVFSTRIRTRSQVARVRPEI